MKYSAISLGLLTAFGAYAQDNVPAQPREVVTIEANTPLMQTTDSKQLIGSKQTITSADLGLTPTRSLGEVLRNQLVSVNINDVQNNPFQPDVQYRGFTASPLLGLPQG